jgi:hypothetical protein
MTCATDDLNRERPTEITVVDAARRAGVTKQAIHKLIGRHPSIVIAGTKPILLRAEMIEAFVVARHLIWGREAV